MHEFDPIDERSELVDPSAIPTASLPKGGGAIRGMGEKFAVNPVVGTGSMTIPIGVSAGRSGFTPLLALTYNSAAGNGPFGLGWSLSLSSIVRKTESRLPEYRDADDSDVFILSGAEDLVPEDTDERAAPGGYTVRRYRPRIEGEFVRIERWTRDADGDVHWRTISRENVLTVYGADANSRISDPADPARVFRWLISEKRDDTGNAIQFEYKPEDSTGVSIALAHEHHRGDRQDLSRTANRYIKRIRYGNDKPLLDEDGRRPNFITPAQRARVRWLFEIVFDYGEHDLHSPSANDDRPWTCRHDPFSTYRSGFEIRTYRLCRRILMFHHFAEEAGVGDDCLVRSVHFSYANTEAYTYLESVTTYGCKRTDKGVQRASFPPLQFEYSAPVVDDRIQTVAMDSLTHMPEGVDEDAYIWLDLYGEGMPGILTEQGGQWWYKRNLSPVSTNSVSFAPAELVDRRPNASLSSGKFQWLDGDGDGRLDLVCMQGPVQGMYGRDKQGGWRPFRPFRSPLHHDARDPNARMIDLDGDGIADVIITGQDEIVWYASEREEGFTGPRKLAQALDENNGPRVVFADGTGSIHLADMSGDGLVDLVRIRNGEVCYWPNLGYGRFGAKVTMDDSPVFDHSDRFDSGRIRLADLDGSGTTDIVYLHAEGVRLYMNGSGNRFSAVRRLNMFPDVNDVSTIAVVDLKGNGTACLVWSSPLPADSGHQMRYIDLTGGSKPHLLCRIVNNMGAETRIRYAPSTRFYVADRLQGSPWTTYLPYPVHVVEQVETFDHVQRSRFVNRYEYHHGCYDGIEREFRGFAMVEQHDTEAYDVYADAVRASAGTQTLDPELNQPPVTTRTWYHTGTLDDERSLLHPYEQEYDQGKRYLPDVTLPADMLSEWQEREWAEAIRALKGLLLRQEVYSFDGSASESYPYSVTEHTYELRQLQRHSGRRRHAVFMPVQRETVTFHYDRQPDDPRITHLLRLEVDEKANANNVCQVVYGRKLTDDELPPEVIRDQQQLVIISTEKDYTADLDELTAAAAYRLRVPYAIRTYEMSGLTPDSGLFALDELRTKVRQADEIDYEIEFDRSTPQKRLISHRCTRFLDDDRQPLPFGEWDTLGLVYQSYQLAFTPSVAAIYDGDQITEEEFHDAGYVRLDEQDGWWIPSGTAVFSERPQDMFYLPSGSRDPFGIETVLTYDRYTLLLERKQVKQAAWNTTIIDNDYRTLGPYAVTDPNGNRSSVETDAFGMVTASYVSGKQDSGEGDTVDEPSVRMEYELFNWMDHGKPNYVRLLSREQHAPASSNWQESFTYWNGSGGIAMVKSRTNPGKVPGMDADNTVYESDADPRWVANGRIVINNKGNPVKQYEPYFSATPDYEEEEAMRAIGSTPIIYYDALGRVIRTEQADGTFAMQRFSAWHEESYDAVDTVRDSRWYAFRGSPDPETDSEPTDAEARSAWLAARHANTPNVRHFDSLGRTVLAVTDLGGGAKACVRSESDATGRSSKVFDPLGRLVTSGFTGMSGAPIYGESAEKGKRWTFLNIAGETVKTWDEHGRQFRTEFDVLKRPLAMYARDAHHDEILYQYFMYGDRHPQAAKYNLFGAVHQIYDPSGVTSIEEIDFKGNTLRVKRMLAKRYRSWPDWRVLTDRKEYAEVQSAAEPLLEADEPFIASSEYDALNRPIRTVLVDGTVFEPVYNEANQLVQLRAQIHGQGEFVEFVSGQDFDAKGQRQSMLRGNQVLTQYVYDPETFRLTRFVTFGPDGDSDSDGVTLQDVHYAYDPVGNITRIRDDAQQTHFFRNTVIKPEQSYEYDGAYRLVRATGREHAGGVNSGVRTDADIVPVRQLPHDNDSGAVRKYTQTYEYDLLGNIRVMRHRYASQGGNGGGWTRHYRYAAELDPLDRTNRLLRHSMPGDPDAGPYSGAIEYDAYGNMTRMPHLQQMNWNMLDQLQSADLTGGGTVYYVYDTDGQRIRTVIERNGGPVVDRIQLGAVEIRRERKSEQKEPHFERYTLHVDDNGETIARVDVKTKDDDRTDPDNAIGVPLIRYSHSNGLGSAVLETNEAGKVVSYEEFHPYGTSAYRSAKSDTELSLKRFRFSGKELDNETGFYSFGARYYSPWLGRWTSSDPAGFAGGLNLYRYCANNPVMFRDPDGMKEWRTDATLWESLETGGDNGGRVDTLPEFERWAEQNRIEYEGTPSYDPVTRSWTVRRYRIGERAPPDSAGSNNDQQTQDVTENDGGNQAGDNNNGSQAGNSDAAPPSDTPDPPAEDQNEGSDGERSFFTSSFFRGLLIGAAVTVAVVAVVATGGAALAAIAPAASAAIASSGVGTALAVAGAATTAYSTAQSLRQRDFWNNPISEEEANFNLGMGIGSIAGGAIARPVAGASSAFGNRMGRSVLDAGNSLRHMGPGQFATAGGGTYGNAIAVSPSSVGGVSTSSTATAAGTGMGAGLVFRHHAEWEHRESSGRFITRGQTTSGSDVPPGRRLTWDEQLTVHTERKILRRLANEVKPGDIITIRGTKNPCNPGGRGCQSAMQAFAERHGVKIYYTNTTTGQTWRYP